MDRLLRQVAFLCASMCIAITPAPAAKPPADPLAHSVRAGAWVEGREGPTYVEFIVDQDFAAIRTRSKWKPQPELLWLASPYDALMLLADKRMSFLWQPLTAWAGPSLEPMRNRMIERFRNAAERRQTDFPAGSTAESTVREPVRALLQLTNLLNLTGRSAEAERLLGARLETMRLKPRGWGGIEWYMVAGAMARSRLANGEIDAAIAEYASIERAMGSSPYAVNARVNRAALLAESGRYADALGTIETAWAQFIADTKGDKIPGSERQFAWIRACALHGLGRKDEAKADLKILQEDRELQDPDFVLQPDNSLRLRSAMCMKDVTAVAEILRREVENSTAGATALLWLQPGYAPYGPQREAVEMVRANDGLRTAAQGRMRDLPPELTPALNGWRTDRAP